MRNKGKIIAILLISIMVGVLIISCDPAANLSNPELFEIAIAGLGAAEFAYEIQYGPFEYDDDDEPLPPEPGTYNLAKLDFYDVAGPGEGIEKDQLVLLSGKITYKPDGSGTIESKIKINNFEDLPNGTFTVKLSGGLDLETGIVTVNGRRVTKPNN